MLTYKAIAIKGDKIEEQLLTARDIDEVRKSVRPYLGSADYIIIERYIPIYDEYKPIGMCFIEEALKPMHGTERHRIDEGYVIEYYYASYWRAADNIDIRVKGTEPAWLYRLNKYGGISATDDTRRHDKAKGYASYIMARW